MSQKTFIHKWILDDSQYKKGMSGVQRQTNAFASSLKSVGTLIAGAFAVTSIINFSRESSRAYQEQISNEAKLRTALKGRTKLANELAGMASYLQGQTLFADEDIINAQSILAIYTQSADQLKKLTPLVLDYAQAFDIDLKTAAQQVGKALVNTNGTIGKSGLEAEGAANSFERFSSVVQLLTDKFGEQARNAIPEELKALRESQVSIEELKEAWGGLVIQITTGQVFEDLVTILNLTKIALDNIANSRGWERFSEIMGLITGGPILNQQYYLEQWMATAWGPPDEPTIFEKVAEDAKDAEEEVTKATSSIAANIASMNKALGGFVPDMPTGPGAGPGSWGGEASPGRMGMYPTPDVTVEKAVADITTYRDTYIKAVADIQQASVNMSEIVGGAFQALSASLMDSIGDVITGQKSFGDALVDFANSVIRIALQMIASFLAQTMAAAFAGGASVGGPAAAITGTTSALSAASAFTGLIPALQFLAEGGIAYGPTMAMIGEYAGARNNPEVVAPLHKLENMLGGGAMELRGKFVIQGKDLVYIVNQENSKLERYR